MKILRRLAKVVIVLVAILAACVAFAYWRTGRAFAQRLHVDEPALTIATDAAAIARGEHVARTHGCFDCHGDDLGGRVVVDAFPVGRVAGPNLTHGAGGLGAQLDTGALERAIRHGLAPNGRPLLFMPSQDYNALSDADAADLIAYVSTRPPVDRPVPAAVAGPLPRVLFVLGRMPLVDALHIDQHAAHRHAVTIAATAEYGAYLASTACAGCHGAHFSGGRVPGTPPSLPPARNITPDTVTGIGNWSKAQFYAAMRQGKRPDGTALDRFMPWPSFASLSNVELDALWAFLHTLPPSPQGQR